MLKAISWTIYSTCFPSFKSMRWLQMKRNARDRVWRTLSQALIEFAWLELSIQNESLCVWNKRLVVLSFMLQLSLRNCAEFCWLQCCEPVKGSGVKVPIFSSHFLHHTQLLIKTDKDLPQSSSILLLILLHESVQDRTQQTIQPQRKSFLHFFYSFP